MTDTNTTHQNTPMETQTEQPMIMTQEQDTSSTTKETPVMIAETQNNTNNNNSNKIKKITVAIILIALIAYVITDSLTNQHIRNGFTIFLEWVEKNPIAGVFAFMGVYFVATVLFAPGSVLTLGSGFVFANAFGLGLGVLFATIAVFVGASLGSFVAFLLGRYLLRDWVQNLTKKYPVFVAIDSALENNGLKIMALLRLSPIIPFNALNYIAGITAVSFLHYAWAMFAILPGTVLYVFIGASAGSLADTESSGGNRTVTIVTIVVGILFGILAIGATSYYAKKELNAVVEKEDGEEETEMNEENGENQV